MSTHQADQLADFEAILSTKAGLSTEQRAIIKSRYIGLVRESERAQWRTALAHHIFGNVIMIAGVVLAALIPLAEFIGDSASTAIFWINWGLALGIAIVNGFMRLFNVSKKYVLGMTSLEKLRAEGWMYLAEIGRYGGKNGVAASPDYNFRLFCARIEKIKDGVVARTADNAVAQRSSDVDETDIIPTWRDPVIRISKPPARKTLTTPRGSEDDNVVVDIMK